MRCFVKVLILLFVLNAISFLGFSQDEADSTSTSFEDIPKLGLSMGLLGVSPFMGPTLDYMVAEKTSFEIGFGVPGPGFGIGFKIHTDGVEPDKRNFHVGLEGGYIEGGFVYLPVGISYYKIKGEYLSFDIGPAFFSGTYAPYINFKVGKKF